MHYTFLAMENEPFSLRERMSTNFDFFLRILFKNGVKTRKFKYHINIKESNGKPTSRIMYKEVEIKVAKKVNGKFNNFVDNYMLFSYHKVIYEYKMFQTFTSNLNESKSDAIKNALSKKIKNVTLVIFKYLFEKYV